MHGDEHPCVEVPVGIRARASPPRANLLQSKVQALCSKILSETDVKVGGADQKHALH